MTQILFVGLEPETVDFSDPALPPGINAEKIHAGIAVAMRQMAERGWHADLCLVRPDGTAVATVERQLAADRGTVKAPFRFWVVVSKVTLMMRDAIGPPLTRRRPRHERLGGAAR